MIDSLSKYIKHNNPTKNELDLYSDALSMSRECTYDSSHFNINEYNLLFQKLNMNSIAEGLYLSFDSCATNIIDNLFNKYVDEDTLVLTSNNEHNSVVNNLKKCKNVEYIIKNLSLDNSLLAKCKKYKRVFVYLIGTHCGNGYVVPDVYFTKIKKYLVENKIDHVFVLDAVQELFLLPRDYSIYDYVIGTAHAIIPNFNMGILLSRDRDGIYPDKKMLSTFVKLMDSLPDVSMFSQLMRMNFGYLLGSNLQLSSGVPYLFNIGNSEGTLKPIIEEKDLMMQNRGFYSINFRGCWFKFGIDTFTQLITRTEKFLEINGYC